MALHPHRQCSPRRSPLRLTHAARHSRHQRYRKPRGRLRHNRPALAPRRLHWPRCILPHNRNTAIGRRQRYHPPHGAHTPHDGKSRRPRRRLAPHNLLPAALRPLPAPHARHPHNRNHRRQRRLDPERSAQQFTRLCRIYPNQLERHHRRILPRTHRPHPPLRPHHTPQSRQQA